MDTDWAPQTCTLPTAEQPLRVAEFDDFLAKSVRSAHRVTAELLHLELVATPEVAARTAELTAQETACCSFFTFTLTASGNGLQLDVVVPSAHIGVLDALAARAGV